MTIINLSRWVAVVVAEAAVYKDTPFEVYVEPIKSHEETKAPLERHPLPFAVEARVEGVSKIANPDHKPHFERLLADPTEGEGAEIYALRSAAQQVSRELERLDDEEGQITATFEASREAQEAFEAQRDHDIATGKLLGNATMKRSPSSRGRPRVPFPWLALLGGLAIAGLVLLEAYSFAVPYLNMFGVDVSRLGKEWRGNPIGVVGGAGFALAASAVVFLLWYLTIRGVLGLGSRDSEGPGMTGVKAVGVLLLGVLLVVFSYYMADMRRSTAESSAALQQSQQVQTLGHSQTASEEMGEGIFMLLTLLVPFAGAYLQHRIGESAIWRQRQELSAERDRWDREERARHLVRDRLVERMALLQAKRNDIEHRRDALRAKRRVLEERVQALAQQRLVALERERRDGVRFANDLYATLAQAHCLYIQAALKRKKYHLLPVPPWDRAHEHSLALVPLERSNGRHFTHSPD